MIDNHILTMHLQASDLGKMIADLEKERVSELLPFHEQHYVSLEQIRSPRNIPR